MPNKALKAVAAPLDVSNRRMLRILRAACSRPLALRYMPLKPAQCSVIDTQMHRIICNYHQPYGKPRRCLAWVSSALAVSPSKTLVCSPVFCKNNVSRKSESVDYQVRKPDNKQRKW
jgi:hypothetical protein